MLHKNTSKVLIWLARASFALMLLLLPFRARVVAQTRPVPGVFGDYTDFLFYAIDAAHLLVLLFWLSSLFLERRAISLGHVSTTFPLLGLMITGLLSCLWSLDSSLSLYHVVRLAGLFGLYLFIVNEIKTFSWFILPLGAQVLLQSVIAVGQSLTQRDIGLWWLGEYSLNPTAPFMSILEVDGVRFLRAYGLSDHPNILGGCLAFGMLALLSFVMTQDSSKRMRYFAGGALVSASVGLLLTYSRSAWVAFAVGSLFVFVIAIAQRNVQGLRRGILLGLTCVALMIPFILNTREYVAARFDVDDSFATNRVERGAVVERLYLYDQAHRIFTQNSLTGIGLGASVIAMQAYYPVFRMSYQPPHVSILAVAMEMGVFGAVFFVAANVLPFYFVFRNRQYLHDANIILALTLVLAVTVLGLFDHYPWMLVPGRMLQWLGWGMFVAAVERFEAKNGQPARTK